MPLATGFAVVAGFAAILWAAFIDKWSTNALSSFVIAISSHAARPSVASLECPDGGKFAAA
jgi:hypothetical protein